MDCYKFELYFHLMVYIVILTQHGLSWKGRGICATVDAHPVVGVSEKPGTTGPVKSSAESKVLTLNLIYLLNLQIYLQNRVSCYFMVVHLALNYRYVLGPGQICCGITRSN